MRTVKYVDCGLVLKKGAPGIHYIGKTEYDNIIDVIEKLISISIDEKCEVFCAWDGLKYERVIVLNVLKKMGYTYKMCNKNNLRKYDFRCKLSQGQCYYIQICTGYRKYVTLQGVDAVINQKHPAESIKELKSNLDLYHYTRNMYLKGLKRSETRVLYGASTISRGVFNRKFKGYSSAIRHFDKDRNVLIDDFIRPGLHTGYNAIAEKAYNYNKDGVVLDVNSLYTYCITMKKMPGLEMVAYGEGVPDTKYSDFETSYYSFWRVEVSALLKENGIPCIIADRLNDFICPEYLRTMDHRILTLSESDRRLLYDNYDISYFKIKGYMIFNAVYGGAYAEYLRPIYNKKKQSQGVARDYAKIMQNGLIGSFSKRAYKNRYIVYEDGDDYGIKPIYLTADEYENERKKTDGLCYITSAVTSAGREAIISYIKKYRDRWLYTDTDSIHLMGTKTPDDIPLSDLMGDFKIEHTFTKCIYKTLKNYIFVENGKIAPTIAGIKKDTLTDPVYPKGIDKKYISRALAHKDLTKLYQKPLGMWQIIEDLSTLAVSYETTTGWLQTPDASKIEMREREERKIELKKEEYWREKHEQEILRGHMNQCILTYNRIYKGKKLTFDQALKKLRGMYYQGNIYK